MTSQSTSQHLQPATFAGGCFWCMEPPFRELDGVKEIFSGFAGPGAAAPSYYKVASGGTPFREALQLFYDPSQVSYQELVETYWRHVDPTDSDGQFADRGYQYTTAIYYHDQAQKEIAEQSKAQLHDSQVFTKPIVTPIEPFTNFFPAEPEHQDYARRNPLRYEFYAQASGRKGFLKKTWKDHL